jgi:N-acetylglucosaminyl-diphospho-decaprenol L-rhamnosyltransferase
MTDLTIVTVTYNSACVIARLLESLAAVDATKIVVDNGSTDETARIAAGYSGVRVMRNRNTGYGRAANLGFQQTQTPYVMVVNPDVVLGAHAIDAMLAAIRGRPDIGIVGARMFHRPGNGGKVFTSDPAFDAQGLAYVPWIIGALMLMRRDALQKVGMFDENIFLFYEEKDLCSRFEKAGYKLAVVASAEAEHAEASSSTPSLQVLKIKAWHASWSMAYYYRKHFSRVTYARKASSKIARAFAGALGSLLAGNGQGAVHHLYELSGTLAACLGLKAFHRDVGRLT